MLDDRRALRRGRSSQSLPRRQTAAGPLRPRRREKGAEQGRAGQPSAGSVALSPAPAGASRRFAGLYLARRRVRRAETLLSLGETMTPLVPLPMMAKKLRGGEILVK